MTKPATGNNGETDAPKRAAEEPKIKRDKQGRREYRVTDHAGAFVAGQRSPAKGKTLWLGDAQAEHPQRNGEIEAV
jgi:hypothetical protein